MKNGIAWVDMLFNIIIRLVLIIVMVISEVNTNKKQEDIQSDAKFVMVLEWETDSTTDLDLWVQNPAGQRTGFRQRDVGGLFLDRDDMGSKQHFIVDMESGQVIPSPIRREIMNIVQPMPGEYIVNVHVYSKPMSTPSTHARVQIIEVEKNIKLYEGEHDFTYSGEEYTFARLTMSRDGKITQIETALPFKMFGR